MAIHLERRKAVMARSKRLGHCVCDPRKGCPCDTLREHNICPCAGEKLPVKTGAVPLTKHVRHAGCASKIGQADLLRILGGLPTVEDPRILIGSAAGDDAGVYEVDSHCVLVQTVDVFTPCVDDPYLFGQIAAANSVSDVYAMGGRPITALSIIGFPIDKLDGAIMEAILRGGLDKLAEAGCSLIGGHSINDEEIKCGFAVTGLIDRNRVVTRDAPRPGDVLVLTKPLGTGMVCFAVQIGRLAQSALDLVGQSMATLNRDAAQLMLEHGAHACTDVTGFGLAGHLVEMVRKGNVAAELDLSLLPVFGLAKSCLDQGILSGAIERNQEYAMAWIRTDEGASEQDLPILYDPQTSGGLLISLPFARAEGFVEAMRERGHIGTAVIGRIVERETGPSEGRITVVNARVEHLLGDKETISMERYQACCDEQAVESCCDLGDGAQPAGKSQVASLFMDFMKEANREGRVDLKTKKLIAIALSISRHCEPCLEIHLKGGLAMGLSREEIDEAANLAVAFAGCPALMFYKDMLKKMGLTQA